MQVHTPTLRPSWGIFLRPFDSITLTRYCLVAYFLVVFGSVFIGAALIIVSLLVDVDLSVYFGPPRYAEVSDLVVSGIVIPAVETVLLSVEIAAISLLSKNARIQAVASAVLWAALHGAYRPISFMFSAWAFYVFASGFIEWRENTGYFNGLLAAYVPHALANSTTLTLMLL